MNEDQPSEQTAPALWNPNAAANWSLLFSPAFGAFFHARNAKVLGRLDEAKANQMWFYGELAFLALATLCALVPSLRVVPIRFVGVVILLTWYFSLASKQITFVNETYRGAYTKKSWGPPLLIGFACFLGYVLVASAIRFVIALAFRAGGA